jgi:hypothetical protein
MAASASAGVTASPLRAPARRARARSPRRTRARPCGGRGRRGVAARRGRAARRPPPAVPPRRRTGAAADRPDARGERQVEAARSVGVRRRASVEIRIRRASRAGGGRTGIVTGRALPSRVARIGAGARSRGPPPRLPRRRPVRARIARFVLRAICHPRSS